MLYSAAKHFGLRAHAVDVPRLLQLQPIDVFIKMKFAVSIPGDLFQQTGYLISIWLFGVLDLRNSANNPTI